jgi:transcriptional regulator with XRE-family HTH domain
MTPERYRQLRGQRIRQIREKAGLTMAQLGEMLEVSPQAVNQWEQGDTSPTTKRLGDLARKFDVDFSWLMYGLAVDANLDHEPDNPFHGAFVPLLDSVDTETLESVPKKKPPRVHTYFTCSRRAFAWIIQDNRNVPDYAPEDVVIVDQEVHPRPGDIVLVRGDNDVFIGRYTLTGQPPSVQIRFVNPDWGTYLVSDPKKQIVGVVSEHTRFLLDFERATQAHQVKT